MNNIDDVIDKLNNNNAGDLREIDWLSITEYFRREVILYLITHLNTIDLRLKVLKRLKKVAKIVDTQDLWNKNREQFIDAIIEYYATE